MTNGDYGDDDDADGDDEDDDETRIEVHRCSTQVSLHTYNVQTLTRTIPSTQEYASPEYQSKSRNIKYTTKCGTQKRTKEDKHKYIKKSTIKIVDCKRVKARANTSARTILYYTKKEHAKEFSLA